MPMAKEGIMSLEPEKKERNYSISSKTLFVKDPLISIKPPSKIFPGEINFTSNKKRMQRQKNTYTHTQKKKER